jgi:hypothetical protein
MDASAFIDREAWEKILTKLGLEDIEISDNRYNHVVHMQVRTTLIFVERTLIKKKIKFSSYSI